MTAAMHLSSNGLSYVAFVEILLELSKCLILLEEKSSGELQVEGSYYHLGGGLGFSVYGVRDVWCWVANSCQVACKSGNNGEVNWEPTLLVLHILSKGKILLWRRLCSTVTAAFCLLISLFTAIAHDYHISFSWVLLYCSLYGFRDYRGVRKLI